jgi:YhcH/YjgK/YiaL family protein
VGKYPIDGDDVFALVQTYESRPRQEGKWEAHRKFIDVQFVAQGKEQLGWANLNRLKVSEPYSDENDVLFLEGEGDFVTAEAGTFVIFAPQDAHMPGIAAGNPQKVKKVVVKVRV